MQYQKEEVRARIVEAAIGEFSAEGFYRASMLQISNRAKVPIGNLYRYFKSKDALFDAIVGTAQETLKSFIRFTYDANRAPERTDYDAKFEMARRVADALAGLANKYKREIMLLVQKSEGSKYADFGDEITAMVEEMFHNGIYLGGDEPEKILMSKIIAKGFVDGAFAIFINCPFDTQAAQLVKLFVFYFNKIEERV